MTLHYPAPKCERCLATQDVIVGDGPSICSPCVAMLGEVAADPATASRRVREKLLEIHGDVLSLVRDGDVLAWDWKAPWPVAGA